MLQNNALSGPLPPELALMTALTALRLDFNNFSGPIPPELFGLGQVWAAALPEGSMAVRHTQPPLPPSPRQQRTASSHLSVLSFQTTPDMKAYPGGAERQQA